LIKESNFIVLSSHSKTDEANIKTVENKTERSRFAKAQIKTAWVSLRTIFHFK
jgi:uncharacterized protein with GYD domain